MKIVLSMWIKHDKMSQIIFISQNNFIYFNIFHESIKQCFYSVNVWYLMLIFEYDKNNY